MFLFVFFFLDQFNFFIIMYNNIHFEFFKTKFNPVFDYYT